MEKIIGVVTKLRNATETIPTENNSFRIKKHTSFFQIHGRQIRVITHQPHTIEENDLVAVVGKSANDVFTAFDFRNFTNNTYHYSNGYTLLVFAFCLFSGGLAISVFPDSYFFNFTKTIGTLLVCFGFVLIFKFAGLRRAIISLKNDR